MLFGLQFQHNDKMNNLHITGFTLLKHAYIKEREVIDINDGYILWISLDFTVLHISQIKLNERSAIWVSFFINWTPSIALHVIQPATINFQNRVNPLNLKQQMHIIYKEALTDIAQWENSRKITMVHSNIVLCTTQVNNTIRKPLRVHHSYCVTCETPHYYLFQEQEELQGETRHY